MLCTVIGMSTDLKQYGKAVVVAPRYGSGHVPPHCMFGRGDVVVLLDLVTNGKGQPVDWFCRSVGGERYGHIGEQYLTPVAADTDA